MLKWCHLITHLVNKKSIYVDTLWFNFRSQIMITHWKNFNIQIENYDIELKIKCKNKTLIVLPNLFIIYFILMTSLKLGGLWRRPYEIFIAGFCLFIGWKSGWKTGSEIYTVTNFYASWSVISSIRKLCHINFSMHL